MKAQDLKIGSTIEYLNGEGKWIESVVKRTTDSYVWFKGSGYDRIKRTTFQNWPGLYRIKII